MASFSVTCPKTTSFPQCSSNNCRSKTHQHNRNNISCLPVLNSRPSSLLSKSSPFQSPYRKQADFWRLNVQVNEVAGEESLNSAPIPEAKPQAASTDEKNEPSEETSISAFMSEVVDLVKMVDSRDIVELKLKQLGCELTIRKKEAMKQPPPAAPVYTVQPPIYQSQPPPQPASAAPPTPTPAPVPALPAPAKPSNPSHPPLKCPMAGTFYCCPAPGEPPFVKVGDRVQKGQVICIIEAMKLMNEIEADQSGTLTEVLAEDGKPVSVDMPLFVIVS